jgi:hypothetical protein
MESPSSPKLLIVAIVRVCRSRRSAQVLGASVRHAITYSVYIQLLPRFNSWSAEWSGFIGSFDVVSGATIGGGDACFQGSPRLGVLFVR